MAIKKIPITGPLTSKVKDGYVVESSEILDTQQSKRQDAINQMVLTGVLSPFDEVVTSTSDNTFSDGTLTSVSKIVFDTNTKRFYALDSSGNYYSLWEGSQANDMYMDSTGKVLQNKPFFSGSSLYAWSTTESNLIQISSDSSNGTGFYNVTDELNNGLALSVSEAVTLIGKAKIADKKKKAPFIMTFKDNDGVWEDWRFIGTATSQWGTATSWERHDAGQCIKGIKINNVEQTPDSNNVVNIPIDTVEVDETLDQESTNPVQNKAIATKITEIEDAMPASMEADVSEDASTVTLKLKNKSNTEIASVDFPAGGGGSGTTSTTRINISATANDLTTDIIRKGDSVKLKYTYDHVYTSGDNAGTSTGQKATIVIQLKRGSTTTYTSTTQDVSAGTYELDITDYVFEGTTDCYVIASTTDPDSGNAQKRQGYCSIRAYTLSLSSSFDLASTITSGGLSNSDSLSIPFTVNGAGTKSIYLYVDGVQRNVRTITRSGTTNDSFSLAMIGLASGRHNVQMKAEMQASDTLTLTSNSIFIDFMRSGNSAPFIGLMASFDDGRIFDINTYLTPTIETEQFAETTFNFVCYDPDDFTSDMSIYRNSNKTQSVSVARKTQSYTNRFTEQATNNMKFVSGSTEYIFYIKVTASSLNINEVTYGNTLKLSSYGRSNEESDPGVWEDNGIVTEFTGFDYSSNGWTGTSLKLTNGSAIVIDTQPFSSDVSKTGWTFEIEYKCTNVTDRDGTVLSCLDSGKGLVIASQKASLLTGETKLIYDEDGKNPVSKPLGLISEFASDMWIKLAFVVRTSSDNRLMEMFVNGIRCGSDQYSSTFSFAQSNPKNISISSDSADVEIRNIRLYNRALTEDEELTNYIVDRTDTDDMISIYNNNEVLDDTGSDIDIDKLRAMGKSVMRIVGAVDQLNITNNKKSEIIVDVYFYSTYGKEYDFVLKNAGLRIQGTSSVKYPRKNYRLYFARSAKYGTTLAVNGVDVPSLTYVFKPGARAIDIFCLKADYSDSSSVLNTGLTKIVNDVFQSCGWLTPPQKVDSTIRIGIDGFPMDLFFANNVDDENTYLGKYNFNNEKSGSGKIFGFEGVSGYNDSATLGTTENPCMCLEFLDNSAPLCLFNCGDDVSTYLDSNFDASFEFRYPENDMTWSTATTAKKQAVIDLFTWINKVKNDNTTFYKEVSEHFDVSNLCAWYIVTDYFMSVDSRAKNLMLATWDGKIWFFLPYDMDTSLGKRNDCYMAYNYLINRDTYDSERSKYAFEGHDSILWNLVLANMTTELVSTAQTLRGTMHNVDVDEEKTAYNVLYVLNVLQMKNWCERVYNHDGDYKYIQPLTVGVNVNGTQTYYNYLYALNGSDEARRNYTIKNRFLLMDAKYQAGTYRADALELYLSRKSTDVDQVITLTATEAYYFGWGLTSREPIQIGLASNAEDDTISLTFTGTLAMNDPISVYGASRVKTLDMRNIANSVLGRLSLNKCTSLRELNINATGAYTNLSGIDLDSCKQLRKLSIEYQQGFTSLDLSNNTKMEELDAANTILTGATFAQGAPVNKITLPGTFTTLILRSLNKLTESAIILADKNSIQNLWIDSCSQIDAIAMFKEYYALGNLKYVRIAGLNVKGDGSDLKAYMAAGLKGYDANGSTMENACGLQGVYQLTTLTDDNELSAMQAYFPELTIRQQAYSDYKIFDNTEDSECVTNIDNGTGYDNTSDYVASGHVVRIRNKFVSVAGVFNSTTKKVKMYKLNPADDSQLEDGTSLVNKFTTESYDVFMYVPHYWYKGINDYFNQEKHTLLSSNKDKPADTWTQKNEGKLSELMYKDIMAINMNTATVGTTLTDSLLVSQSSCAVYRLNVENMKRVRYVGLNQSTYGAVFVDSSSKILDAETLAVTGTTASPLDFNNDEGDYVYRTVPDTAKYIYFTALRTVDQTITAFAVDTDDIEAIEPGWVEHKSELIGKYGASIDDLLQIRSITGKKTVVGTNTSTTSTEWQYDSDGNATNTPVGTMNYTVQDLLNLCSFRGAGFEGITYEQSKDIAVLSYCYYGNLDDQRIYGFGNGSGYMTGTKDTLARLDTIWNKDSGVNKVFGLEGFDVCNAEWLDNVGVNITSYVAWKKKYRTSDDGTMPVDHIWHIYNSHTKTERTVQGINTSGYCLARTVHGRYCDIIAKTLNADNSKYSTRYGAAFWYSSSIGRVVCRASNGANANGGLACVHAYYASSFSDADFGERLSFEGGFENENEIDSDAE